MSRNSSKSRCGSAGPTVCLSWGESNDSYALQSRAAEDFGSTPYQTAWALLALMSAGEASSEAVRRGTEYLLHSRQADALWSHPSYTAPGFPRVFYLRYHLYPIYFPLLALCRWRAARRIFDDAPDLARLVSQEAGR